MPVSSNAAYAAYSAKIQAVPVTPATLTMPSYQNQNQNYGQPDSSNKTRRKLHISDGIPLKPAPKKSV